MCAVQVEGEPASGQQGFEQFFKELREEAAEMGEENVTVEEAQELWIMMRDELEEVMSMDQGKSGSGNGLEEMTRHLQQFDLAYINCLQLLYLVLYHLV